MSWNLQVKPKFISAYDKLFQAALGSPVQLNTLDSDEFWTDLFFLDVDKTWLSDRLQRLNHEDCLGQYKSLLNLLFRRPLSHFSNAPYDHPRKVNALETLIVFVRTGFSKQFSGWEIMEVFAGGVGESDALFSDFTRIIDGILQDDEAPAEIKHRTLQLALIFVCGVNQLSPGAYFLRRDLYHSLVSMILSPKTQMFTFETTLLLSILSNFHRSDAAKTNPYLNQIKRSTDEELMKRISWVAAFATQRTVVSYQQISDDSPPSLATSFGSLFTSMRPDRALSSTPVDPPRELFKNQPIEAAVMVLPVYDFLRHNQIFRDLFASTLASPMDPQSTSNTQTKTPLPQAVLSLSSYLLTHASSTSSPRVLAYAHLSLTILLVCVEDESIVNALCQPPPQGHPEVRLCRQRQPYLPYASSPRPSMCALMDCCVLWVRHNLHKRLEVHSYITCIRIIHRAVWFTTTERIRLEYHWEELWRSLILLLDFAANQVGTLKSVAKVDELVQETICLLDFATRFAERFLPDPQSLHQLVYELVRAKPALSKQAALLKGLRLPSTARRASTLSPRGTIELGNLERIAGYYEKKLAEGQAQTVGAVMKLIAKEVEQDGIYGVEEPATEDLPRYSDDVADYGFVRWACTDGLALLRD